MEEKKINSYLDSITAMKIVNAEHYSQVIKQLPKFFDGIYQNSNFIYTTPLASLLSKLSDTESNSLSITAGDNNELESVKVSYIDNILNLEIKSENTSTKIQLYLFPLDKLKVPARIYTYETTVYNRNGSTVELKIITESGIKMRLVDKPSLDTVKIICRGEIGKDQVKIDTVTNENESSVKTKSDAILLPRNQFLSLSNKSAKSAQIEFA